MMREILVVTIFALLSVISTAQDASAPNRMDEKGQKQGFWRKEVNGRLIYEGTFKDDVPVGKFKRYKNGKLAMLMFYQESSDTVFVKKFSPNNQVEFEGAYVDQEKWGLWHYFSGRRLILSENYSNGQKSGVSEIYDVNQNLKMQLNWENDTLNGPIMEYYSNGRIKWKSQNIKGKREGDFFSYYPNGKMQTLGTYVDNLKEGNWIYLNKNSDTILIETYISGQLTKSVNSMPDERFNMEEIKKNSQQFKDPAEYKLNPAEYFLGK